MIEENSCGQILNVKSGGGGGGGGGSYLGRERRAKETKKKIGKRGAMYIRQSPYV